jgi:CDP-diacylglycerol---glycerol-3-phosphate 3-phosphatidyltransferase
VSHGIVPDRLARSARIGIGPLARGLVAAGVTANAVTFTGGALTVLGGALIALDRPQAALIALLLGTACDTLDGAVARASGGGTRLGAFLDSVIDRVADAAIFGGTAALGAALGFGLLFWTGLIALIASSLVPYVRAKAESLGVSATVGPGPREARIVILLVGLLAWAAFGENELYIAAVAVLAALAIVTFVQRVAHVAARLEDTKEGT